MELGNMIFGNSRGIYPIGRGVGYEAQLERLFDAYTPNRSWGHGYSPAFENDTFEVSPYWWGDCTCDAGEDESKEHSADCELVKPNFLYKPTSFSISWYKYPLRDSYMSQQLTIAEFATIIDKCIESLEAR